jgi:hypothetical protein
MFVEDAEGDNSENDIANNINHLIIPGVAGDVLLDIVVSCLTGMFHIPYTTQD